MIFDFPKNVYTFLLLVYKYNFDVVCVLLYDYAFENFFWFCCFVVCCIYNFISASRYGSNNLVAKNRLDCFYLNLQVFTNLHFYRGHIHHVQVLQK